MFKNVAILVVILFPINHACCINWAWEERNIYTERANISLITEEEKSKIGKSFFQPTEIDWSNNKIVYPELKARLTSVVEDDNFDLCPLRNHEKTGWQKIKNAAVRITGVEVLGVFIILSLPEKYSKWPPDAINYARTHVIAAYTQPPVMDIDDWPVNYLGHPYAGAAYYNAVRSQDGTVFQSFMLATFESLLWEYAIEVYSEHPSIQDLLTTSPLGSVLGELAHRATIRMRRDGFTFSEKVIALLINPSFVANNGFDPYKSRPKIKVE